MLITYAKKQVIARTAPFVNEKRIIMKSFIELQFGHCPLIRMLHSRGLYNKINRIMKEPYLVR